MSGEKIATGQWKGITMLQILFSLIALEELHSNVFCALKA